MQEWHLLKLGQTEELCLDCAKHRLSDIIKRHSCRFLNGNLCPGYFLGYAAGAIGAIVCA